MLYRQLVITVSLIAGLATAAVAFNLAAQTPQAGNSKEIDALMGERRDVLVKLVEVVRGRYEQGLVEVDKLYRAQNELLNAELEFAKTREERIAALDSQLANFRSLEKHAIELQRVGAPGGGVEAVLTATAGRLHAEIRLLRESATEK